MLIDLEKLMDIRAKHGDLHDRYRALTEKARQAAHDAARMHSEVATEHHHTEAHDLFTSPAHDLAAVSTDQLILNGVDIRVVRRILDAYRQAARLRGERDTLAARLRTSRALLDRLNAYAQQFPEAQ